MAVPQHTDVGAEERDKLNAAIDRSLAEVEAGQGIPVEQALAELRARRVARMRAARR